MFTGVLRREIRDGSVVLLVVNEIRPARVKSQLASTFWAHFSDHHFLLQYLQFVFSATLDSISPASAKQQDLQVRCIDVAWSAAAQKAVDIQAKTRIASIQQDRNKKRHFIGAFYVDKL